jgi:hypothetical protein
VVRFAGRIESAEKASAETGELNKKCKQRNKIGEAALFIIRLLQDEKNGRINLCSGLGAEDGSILRLRK